jgi:hypothetical protein
MGSQSEGKRVRSALGNRQGKRKTMTELERVVFHPDLLLRDRSRAPENPNAFSTQFSNPLAHLFWKSDPGILP